MLCAGRENTHTHTHTHRHTHMHTGVAAVKPGCVCVHEDTLSTWLQLHTHSRVSTLRTWHTHVHVGTEDTHTYRTTTEFHDSINTDPPP